MRVQSVFVVVTLIVGIIGSFGRDASAQGNADDALTTQELPVEFRLSIRVVPRFVYDDADLRKLAPFFADELTGALVELQRFNVLESTRSAEFSTAPDAEATKSGSIGVLVDLERDGEQAEALVRILFLETTRSIDMGLFQIADIDSPEAVYAAAKSCAIAIGAIFPRLAGSVLSVQEERILIDWDKADGIREGAYALVCERERPWLDEETGEVLEEGGILPLLEVRIARVNANSTAAEVIGRYEGYEGDAREGMLVLAR